jgi:integrase
MSEENLEILRRGYEQFNRAGEFDLGLFDPNVEFDNSNAVFDPAVYRGRECARELLALWREMCVPWAGFHTFRHTCASLLFEGGRNIRQVQQ